MKNRLTKNQAIFCMAAYVVFYALLTACCLLLFVRKSDEEFFVKLGYFIVLAVFLGAIFLYFYFADIEILKSRRKLLAVICVTFVCFLISIFISKVNVFLSPYALCALVLTLLLGHRVALFTSLFTVIIYFVSNLIFSDLTGAELYGAFFEAIVTIILAVFASGRHIKRIHYVFVGISISVVAAATVGLSYLLFYIPGYSPLKIGLGAAYAAGSGLLDVMLMFLLVPALERLFNLTTDFRLAELTSTNNPLIKRLFNEAPGTFNHSLTVANYVEACAMAIGEDTFLARAAAYFHDIGKLKNPNYYVENQTDGHNPHDEIAPELSVSLLKKHIMYGVMLAREYGLPKELESAITEHHGSFPMKFFYYKAKKITEGELDLKNYSYDGPTPTSKINGMLMIVDASEAALRSLNVNDALAAERLVDNIVKERLEVGQFDNCDLTMNEINIVKQTIVTTYVGIRHERVKYPDVKLSAPEGEK